MPEARVIPLRPDDDEPFVPPATAPGWEDQLAGVLDFLRRRAKARTYPSMSRLSLAKPPDGTARACIASVNTAGSREEAP